MRKFLGKWFYNFSWLVCRVIFPFFLHYEVKNRERLENLKPPLLVVANHVSFFDPHLIGGGAFPFNSKVFPIRFAVYPKYYYLPILFPFIWLYGGFPIYRKIGLGQSLRIPLKILQKEGTVGIFPRGKIHRYGRLRKGRRGAGYLALKANVPIIPIRIDGLLNMSFKEFLLRKRKAVINVGEKFSLPDEIKKSGDINQATNFITDELIKPII